MEFSDGMSIASQIECIEADAWAELQLAVPEEHRTRIGIQVHRHGRALSLLTTGIDNATVNRTFGLGFDEEFSLEQFDRIALEYSSAGIARWLVQWSPGAKPADPVPIFTARGGRRVSPTIKLWRPVVAANSVTVAPGLRVVEIGLEDAAMFEATVAKPLGVPTDMAPGIRSTIGHPGWHFYLVFDDQRPIAGAAMFVHGDGAWFGVSGTATTDRGRGAQTALLARRLHDAEALGCKWVSADTRAETAEQPNPSFHNMRRAGLDVLYERPTFLFATAESTSTDPRLT
jgi:hypothetical protein